MLVSVVIPAYNAQAFLAQAVESVLAQTYQNLEVIIVDDGSVDSTREIAESFTDDRVRIVAKRNGGLPSARNAGLDVARGQAIAFLDADDLFDPTKIERQVAVLETRVDVVGTFVRVISADSRRSMGTLGMEMRHRIPQMRTASVMPFVISSTLCTASVIERAGRFDESLSQCEDLDFLTRCARAGRVEVIAEPLGSYRMHRQSMTALGHGRQLMVVRFLQARYAALDAGWPAPEFELFCANYRMTRLERRQDRGAIYYRAAGVAAVNGALLDAARFAVLSAVCTPIETGKRLISQRGRTNVRSAVHGS
jgi:glycosyltransferase involved in cell wall biosynthesis